MFFAVVLKQNVSCDKNISFSLFIALFFLVVANVQQQLKTLGLLQAFAESADWAPLSWLCDHSHMYISVCK